MKAVIYTTHSSTRRMREDIPVIERYYKQLGESIDITIRKVAVTPKIEQGEVSWQWFEETLDYEDYSTVCFDMTVAQWKAWGIKGAAGMYRQDGETIREFWIAHDHGQRIGKWSKLYPQMSEFAYIFLHEVLHGECRALGIPDTVHERSANGTMLELFKEYGKVRKQKTFIGQLILQVQLLTKQLLNMKRALPIPEENWNTVTQEYLVEDDHNYPRTGVHPGVDFRGKFGDPIFAPMDGELTNSGHTPTMGFWMEYHMGSDYMIAAHLRTEPKRGFYKRGEQIAAIGATGKIQGVHYHLEGWYAPMDRNKLLDADAVKRLTFDIRTRIG